MESDMNFDWSQSGIFPGSEGEDVSIHCMTGNGEEEASPGRDPYVKARKQIQQVFMIQYEINNSNQDLKKHLWVTSCNNTLHINSTLQFMECLCLFDFQNTHLGKVTQDSNFHFTSKEIKILC